MPYSLFIRFMLICCPRLGKGFSRPPEPGRAHHEKAQILADGMKGVNAAGPEARWIVEDTCENRGNLSAVQNLWETGARRRKRDGARGRGWPGG